MIILRLLRRARHRCQECGDRLVMHRRACPRWKLSDHFGVRYPDWYWALRRCRSQWVLRRCPQCHMSLPPRNGRLSLSQLLGHEPEPGPGHPRAWHKPDCSEYWRHGRWAPHPWKAY